MHAIARNTLAGMLLLTGAQPASGQAGFGAVVWVGSERESTASAGPVRDFAQPPDDRLRNPPSGDPPVAIGPIPGQTVQVGNTLQLTISAYFHDPDGDDLTYTTTSERPDVVLGQISDSTLTIAGVARGIAILKVVASDKEGSAEHRFEITVAEPRPWWPWTERFGIDPRLLAVSGHHFVQIGAAKPGEVRIFGNERKLDLQLIGVDVVGYVNRGQGRIGANFGLGFTQQMVNVVPDSAGAGSSIDDNSPDTSRTTSILFLSATVFLQFGNYLRLNSGLVTGIASNLGLPAGDQDDTAFVIGVSLSTVLEETIKAGLARIGS